MLRKLVYGILILVAIFSSPVALADQPSGYFINLNLIPQVECVGTDAQGRSGRFSGTASYIGTNKFLTAEHVVHGMSECRVGNKILVRIEDNVRLDYAIFSLLGVSARDLPQEVLNVSCTPFRKDQAYLAVGYALGRDFTVQRLMGSSNTSEQEGFVGEVILTGKTFPGMSGGPIFDDRGAIVGIVNGGDSMGRATMLSRSLLDTSLCR